MRAKTTFTIFGDGAFMLLPVWRPRRTLCRHPSPLDWKPAKRLLFAGLALALAGCTAGDVMRPALDVGTTQALPQQALPQQALPQRALPQPALLQPTLPEPHVFAQPPATALAAPTAQSAPILLVTPDGVVEAPPEMQTLRPQFEAASPTISTAPLALEQGSITTDTDIEPRQDEPGMMAQLAALPGRMVPDFLKPGGRDAESQCRRELKRLGVRFEDIAAVGNGGAGGCGIANPVKVSGLAGGVSVKPAAVLNCQMALAFAQWVKKDVQPAALTRYLSRVDTIKQMSSYSCRTIGNKKGGRLSEHSFGNAIDIGGIVLKNGKQVMVRKPGFFALRESSLLNKIRADACDRFTTVLGPGYDRAHADHFHLDLMSRKRTSCQ